MPAFSKVRVVYLTHVIASPFCTYQLAVLGDSAYDDSLAGLPPMGMAEHFARDARCCNFYPIQMQIQIQPRKNCRRLLFKPPQTDHNSGARRPSRDNIPKRC